MHEFIRETVLKTFGKEIAEMFLSYTEVVLNQCKEIFSKPDVDGG
jgi:triosephosphate isomerase